MENHGLRFDVRRFCGAPLITLSGNLDSWQFEMLRNLLHSFKWKGHKDVILNFSNMNLTARESADALAEALRSWRPEMAVHLVAQSDVAKALGRITFPFRTHLCSSMDEAAEYICRSRRTMDERFLRTDTDQQSVTELPIAA